jgi:transmembrane sensor
MSAHGQDGMAERIEWEALVSYLTDRSDEEERRFVEAWLADSARARVLDQAMQSLSERPAELFRAYDAERASERLLARMRSSQREALRAAVPARRRMMLSLAIAASILVTTGAGVWMWHEWAVQELPREWVMMETGRGETREISFPSGTRVVLAAMSRLRTPRGETSPSEVELEGEAFVELGARQRRPFVLRMRGAEVVDRGTAFVAREYLSDTLVRVAVVQGRVEIRAAGAGARSRGRSVTAGEVARMSPGDAQLLVERGNVERELAWMRGDLAFEATPLPELARTLERWLEVDIRIADSSMATRRFTGRLRTRSVSEVGEILAAVLDARVEQAGHVLTIGTK